MARLLNSLRHTPLLHVILPTIAAMVVVVGATAIYLPGIMDAATIESARHSNVELADLIKTTRGYYTRQVVAKALKNGSLTPSYDHHNDDNAIPLPATFVKDISDILQKKDVTLSLLSPYPWPHRADRKMDEFQTMAWEAFQREPDAVFFRQEIVEGRRVLRVAVADRMTGPTCVSCHNSDPLSTRRDWKVGDVRAVMEVTKVVEPHLAAAEERSRRVILSLGAMAVVVILVLLFIAGLMSRRAREKHITDKQVSFLAHHDALTGALNRASFDRTMADLLRQGITRGLAIHYIDIDCFKEVNDKLGHGAGDALIRGVAERLSGVVGTSGDLVARLGGDEFVMAQLSARSQHHAQLRAQEILRAMAPPFVLDQHQLSVSVSVGTIWADGAESIEDLMRGADTALYRAKRDGRRRAVLFRIDMLDELETRRTIERTIRDAVETGSFALHFQPIWGVHARRLIGFEALLRLADRDGNLVSPAIFVPIAEQIGVIGKIGQWVIEEATRVAALWPEHLTVAVNLSPIQFRPTQEGRTVTDVVSEALAQSGLAPRRLELEVTEGLMLENTETVLNELRTLQKLGVSLVMDDFGSGYSSLNYLWKFPFSKIKIDRAFVAASSSASATIAAIVKTITALARTLGMQVTVEGVETEEQVRLFADLGCDQMQGYYLGRPMPAQAVAAAILTDFCQGEIMRAPPQHATVTALRSHPREGTSAKIFQGPSK
jgi:diguanylate cyclase (GGDEF)-like protein